MFSRKRLAYIIIITIIFGGLFFLFNLDHDFLRSQSVNSADELVTLTKISASKLENTDSGFLVVGNPQNESERQIQKNVIKTLDQIKVKMRLVDTIVEADLVNDVILIFVISDVSQIGDLEKIAQYISEGGKAIFAAGMPAGNDMRYLDPVWGILERGSFLTISDITFNQGYFPYEQVTIPGGYTSYSSNVRLDETCDVLVQGNNGIPLVWTHAYNLGRVTMINGTFMESKLSLGILVASINNTREQSIYPILATKTVFLDAIPPLFDGNDDNSFEYYGRSAESFVRDRLWAVLVQKASVLDLKFTSSFMAIDKRSFDNQNANQQTFSYISREIIQNKGEITLSGNHVDLDNLTKERIEKTRSFFEIFFPNYKLHAYYPLYGKIDENQIKLIQSVYPNMDVIRIQYDGDPLTQSLGDYEVKDGYVIFPTTTYGYKAEGLQMYTFLSILTSHGAVSHSFDINSLFTVPSSESNWNTLNKTFDVLSDKYFKQTPWLDAITISPAAERVKDMAELEIETLTENNQITISCSEMVVGQKFMFYSTKKILSSQGANYEQISLNYYLIEAQEPKFVLSY